jgi:hypothetical protein
MIVLESVNTALTDEYMWNTNVSQHNITQHIMMYYNMYTNPAHSVLMTMADIKCQHCLYQTHTHTSIHLHIHVNSNPAGNSSDLVNVVHGKVQPAADCMIPTVKQDILDPPAWIYRFKSKAVQPVGQFKTATQILISNNSKCNSHQETIVYQTYKDVVWCYVIGWGILATFWPWRWRHYIPPQF